MASELEQLDADVRAVVADGHINAEMIDGARSRAASLTQQVAQLKVADIDVSRLLRSLADAETKLTSARDLVKTANARAKGYAASHLAGGGSSSFAGAPSTVAAPADLLGSTLAGKGMRMADVADFDFSDNPITGWDKAPREDVAWAVSRWNDTIAPGIAAGKTRDDFAAIDAASDAPPYRRLANAWDYFLGDDAIHSGGPRPSGGHDVGGGRHRLQVARDLGIRFLPVRFP